MSLCRKKKKRVGLKTDFILCVETSSGHFLLKFTQEHERATGTL